jgi:hypothetical protein
VPPGVVAKSCAALVGRPIARRSVNALIMQVAARLESEVGRRRKLLDGRLVSHAAALLDQGHSEIHVVG